MIKIALIGRPNVGKSTLFNKLIGRRAAIVHDTPGITRDRNYSEMKLGNDERVTLVDTAGFEEGTGDSLAKRMNRISEEAVAECDAVFFVIDGSVGVTSLDEGLAQILLRADKPVYVLVNKADRKDTQELIYEAYTLGFENIVEVSAEHNIGLQDLKGIATELSLNAKETATEEMDDEEEENKPLRMAIVGRPNAGKSTLINQLLNSDRMLTGPEAGLTRESISSMWTYDGKEVELIDTAGLRKKSKINEKIEKAGASISIKAIDRAQVVVLLVDATQPFEQQDRVIASKVVEEGRALIIGLNKWDLLDEHGKEEAMKDMDHLLEHSFSQVKGVEVVTFSAMSGKHVHKLMPKVLEVHKKWQTKIPTSHLNRFLEGMLEAHQPPFRKGRRLKFKYMTQVATRPPTFGIWVNLPDEVPKSYIRYLQNGLREAFELEGVVMRILMRGGANPYESKRKKQY